MVRAIFSSGIALVLAISCSSAAHAATITHEFDFTNLGALSLTSAHNFDVLGITQGSTTFDLRLSLSATSLGSPNNLTHNSDGLGIGSGAQNLNIDGGNVDVLSMTVSILNPSIGDHTLSDLTLVSLNDMVGTTIAYTVTYNSFSFPSVASDYTFESTTESAQLAATGIATFRLGSITVSVEATSAAVPEPGSFLLLSGAGIAAMVVRRRRKLQAERAPAESADLA